MVKALYSLGMRVSTGILSRFPAICNMCPVSNRAAKVGLNLNSEGTLIENY
jgi:hypothetical protein